MSPLPARCISTSTLYPFSWTTVQSWLWVPCDLHIHGHQICYGPRSIPKPMFASPQNNPLTIIHPLVLQSG